MLAANFKGPFSSPLSVLLYMPFRCKIDVEWMMMKLSGSFHEMCGKLSRKFCSEKAINSVQFIWKDFVLKTWTVGQSLDCYTTGRDPYADENESHSKLLVKKFKNKWNISKVWRMTIISCAIVSPLSWVSLANVSKSITIIGMKALKNLQVVFCLCCAFGAIVRMACINIQLSIQLCQVIPFRGGLHIQPNRNTF